VFASQGKAEDSSGASKGCHHAFFAEPAGLMDVGVTKKHHATVGTSAFPATQATPSLLLNSQRPPLMLSAPNDKQRIGIHRKEG